MPTACCVPHLLSVGSSGTLEPCAGSRVCRSRKRRRQTGASEEDKKKPEPPHGRLLVEGEQVAIRIEERLREERIEPTAAQLAREKREYGYHAPRKVSVPTGALRLVRLDTYRTWGEPDRRSWYDRKGKRVEDQIPDLLLGFYELALSIKERREKDEREARRARGAGTPP